MCVTDQPDEVKTTSGRIIILTSYMTSLVLLAAYSAFLTSSLAVQHRELPFRDLHGLLYDSSYRLGVMSNSSYINIFNVRYVYVYLCWIRNIYVWISRRKLYKMNICNRQPSTAVHFSIYIVVILPNFKRYNRPKRDVENKWMLAVDVLFWFEKASKRQLTSTTGWWYQHLLWVPFHTV